MRFRRIPSLSVMYEFALSYHLDLFLRRSSTAPSISSFFFFNDTATTEIYTLSLHDALPISARWGARQAGDDSPLGNGSSDWVSLRAAVGGSVRRGSLVAPLTVILTGFINPIRSEEHTSELQSHSDLVCRLLLEKKKKKKKTK